MGAVSTTVPPHGPATAVPGRVARPIVVGPPRPPLVRPREDRMLGGVAHGLADHLGLSVPATRLLLLASSLVGCFGIFLYLWLWALVPGGSDPARVADGVEPPPSTFKQQVGAMKAAVLAARHGDWPAALFAAPGSRPDARGWAEPSGRTTHAASVATAAPAATAPTAPTATAPPAPTAPAPAAATTPTAPVAAGVPAAPALPPPPAMPWPAVPAAPMLLAPPTRRGPRIRRRGDVLAGALLVLAGGVLLFSRQGWATNPGFVLPLLVVGAGAIIAYAQLDEVERTRWATRSGIGTRMAVLRIIGGLVLVVVGVLLLVVQEADVGQLGRTLLAAVAVLAGSALVLAPWGLRLWRDLDDERAARVRESERADIAAHLHDSVLQTLALIQRRSDGPGRGRPARPRPGARPARLALRRTVRRPRRTLAARVAAIAARSRTCTAPSSRSSRSATAPVDDRTRRCSAALREAVFNAARHAGAPVPVYVEVDADRDRGVRARPRGRLRPRRGAGRTGSACASRSSAGWSATAAPPACAARPATGTEVRLLRAPTTEAGTERDHREPDP